MPSNAVRRLAATIIVAGSAAGCANVGPLPSDARARLNEDYPDFAPKSALGRDQLTNERTAATQAGLEGARADASAGAAPRSDPAPLRRAGREAAAGAPDLDESDIVELRRLRREAL